MSVTLDVTRRDFIRTGIAAGSLVLAVDLTGCVSKGEAVPAGPALAPDAFVRVGTDGRVTVISKHLEMGQGAYTGLATIVAEELDADWSMVGVEGAPADASRYANLALGPIQGTGGSTAMANSWAQLRKAGATARAMLVAAAAAEWGVDPSTLVTEAGVVRQAGGGKRASYGSLVAKASALPVPADVPLKEPKDFRLIGKTVPRLDAKDKSTGKAMFTQDVKLPGMLTAVVLHPPRFGATVKSIDDAAARAVPGVSDVVQIPTGVAVLADGYWPAHQGRAALKVEWDESKAYRESTDQLVVRYRELAAKPGAVARKDGNASGALAAAARKLDVTYEVPFLAHACMEPMNCIVQLGANQLEIWTGDQFQTVDQGNLAKVAGLKPEQVTINMLYAGGSFGRRANPHSDYQTEALTIAQAIKGAAPVKLVWSREDDMRGGYYRPLTIHRMQGGLDAAGTPVAWHQRIVGQSIIAGTAFEPFMIKDGIDGSSVEGAANSRYQVPNFQVELHSPRIPVPVQWWRSVGHTHSAFAVESFVDELAEAAGQDPVEFRRAILANAPRHLGVLNLAAEKAGWGTPLPAGKARGVAVHESFGSFVAEVAEVSIEGGKPRVHRVVVAVDCGLAINPDIVRMQMESCVAYGLSAALYGAITLKDGAVAQGNFNDYQVLRINEMPKVEVHIVPSAEAPTGVGEPGTPPIAPAVTNALYRLAGKRIRSLPITL